MRANHFTATITKFKIQARKMLDKNTPRFGDFPARFHAVYYYTRFFIWIHRFTMYLSFSSASNVSLLYTSSKLFQLLHIIQNGEICGKDDWENTWNEHS